MSQRTHSHPKASILTLTQTVWKYKKKKTLKNKRIWILLNRRFQTHGIISHSGILFVDRSIRSSSSSVFSPRPHPFPSAKATSTPQALRPALKGGNKSPTGPFQ
ncbi:unnamed protein product [Boreogadus saida]